MTLALRDGRGGIQPADELLDLRRPRGCSRFHRCRLDFREYTRQDPELADYSGRHVWIVRCRDCGFGQPEELPRLPRFFERMYDQRWADEWVEREFEARYKDLIFQTILRQLDRRFVPALRGGCSTSARMRALHERVAAGGLGGGGARSQPEDCRLRPAADRRDRSPRRASTRIAGRRTPLHRRDASPMCSSTFPIRFRCSRRRRACSLPGGVVAVKVPSGPAQLRKEQVLSALDRSRPISLAGNLVHVNHFSPRSLRLALERAGFDEHHHRARRS